MTAHESIELLAQVPARPGAAVKLEGHGSMFLGEVAGCRPTGDGFAVQIELHHALYDTQELARLAARILEEDGPR